jgi:hypothetical protein
MRLKPLKISEGNCMEDDNKRSKHLKNDAPVGKDTSGVISEETEKALRAAVLDGLTEDSLDDLLKDIL